MKLSFKTSTPERFPQHFREWQREHYIQRLAECNEHEEEVFLSRELGRVSHTVMPEGDKLTLNQWAIHVKKQIK